MTGDVDELLPDALIQLAAFKGNTRAVFLDRQEARGPIDQQIEDAVLFVKRHINLGSRIAGVYREDYYELPMDSVREMIFNAVCHRSYLSPGSIQVAIYDDRLEVTSPGRISPNLTMEQLMEGNSRVRNVAIGAAFQYMHIIEKWGSGIPRVFQEVQAYGLGNPELRDFGSSFRISVFRKPFVTDSFGVVNPLQNGEVNEIADTNETNGDTNETNCETNDTKLETNDTIRVSSNIALTPNEQVVLVLLQAKPHVTQKVLSTETGLSISTVKRVISELQKKHIIRRKGNNRNGVWEILVSGTGKE